MGTHRSNKHAHPPFETRESKRGTKYLRRKIKGEIINVISDITNSATIPKPCINESNHPVIHAKLRPGDILA